MTAPRTQPDIAQLMRDIHALDWTPDAAYPKQGRPVRYVTTAKIKRQITPVLDRYGLRITLSMTGQPVIDANVALVPYEAHLTDGLTVYNCATIWAEGSNDAGKRTLTSLTNAYRIYTMMLFAIIDGMEDEPPSASAPESRLRPVPESSEEPAVNAPQSKNTPEEVSTPDPLSGLMRRAVESAYRSILASSTLSAEKREEARTRYEAISCDDDASSFLQFKREVMQ